LPTIETARVKDNTVITIAVMRSFIERILRSLVGIAIGDVVAELREGPPPSQGKIVTALSWPEACDISRRVDSLE
jgi:hypothetical protein